MQRLPRSTLVHSSVFWYQYELLYSVIGFPQRLSSLRPSPSQEMYCRMMPRGINMLINGWDKSRNNAGIRDTGRVSQTPLGDTSLERVQRKSPVWHPQRLQGFTCDAQQRGTPRTLFSTTSLFHTPTKTIWFLESTHLITYTDLLQACKPHVDRFPSSLKSILPLLSCPHPWRKKPPYVQSVLTQPWPSKPWAITPNEYNKEIYSTEFKWMYRGELNQYFSTALNEPERGYYVALIAPIGPIFKKWNLSHWNSLKVVDRDRHFTEFSFIPFMSAFENVFSSHLQRSVSRPRFCNNLYIILQKNKKIFHTMWGLWTKVSAVQSRISQRTVQGSLDPHQSCDGAH